MSQPLEPSAATASDLFGLLAPERALMASRDPLQSSSVTDASIYPAQPVRPPPSMLSEGAADVGRDDRDEARFDLRATSGRWESSATGETSDLDPDSHLQQMSNQSAAPSAGGKVFCQSGGSGEDPPNNAVRVRSQPASEVDAMDYRNTAGDRRSRLPPQLNAPAAKPSPHYSNPTKPIDSSAVGVWNAIPVVNQEHSLPRHLTSPVHHNGTADQVPSPAPLRPEQVRRIEPKALHAMAAIFCPPVVPTIFHPLMEQKTLTEQRTLPVRAPPLTEKSPPRTAVTGACADGANTALNGDAGAPPLTEKPPPRTAVTGACADGANTALNGDAAEAYTAVNGASAAGARTALHGDDAVHVPPKGTDPTATERAPRSTRLVPAADPHLRATERAPCSTRLVPADHNAQ